MEIIQLEILPGFRRAMPVNEAGITYDLPTNLLGKSVILHFICSDETYIHTATGTESKVYKLERIDHGKPTDRVR